MTAEKMPMVAAETGRPLPVGWAQAEFHELATIVGGITKGQKRRPTQKLRNVPYLRVANVQRGFLDLSEIKEIEATEAEIEELRLLPGDILLIEGGNREHLGRGWIWRGEIAECIHQNHVFRARLSTPDLQPKFLSWYANEVGQSYFSAEASQTVNLASINLSKLKKLSVVVPPVAEQARIVAKVEALLTRIDVARQRLARVPAILRRFRQAVLAAACSGRLTAEWRSRQDDLEPPMVLLDRIRAERRRIWLDGNRQRGANLQTATYPAITAPNREIQTEMPETWTAASMDEITCAITSGSRDWKQYYHEDGPGTFIMAQNVKPLRLDRSYRSAVNPPQDDRDRVRSQVQEGDILVTIVGANTGDVCRVPERLTQHYVCQSVALMRPVIKSMSAFLELFLNSSEHGQAQYRHWIYGEGRPHLSFDHLRATAVAIPPLPEQYEIVRRVNALFKLADAIEKRVGAARERANRLTQAILAKAFRGELVPTEAELARAEGREYEAASVLLERTRGEGAPWDGPKPKPLSTHHH